MKYKKSVYKSFVLITQLGLSMIAPMLICVFLGSFLEDRFHVKLFVPLLIIGMLAGFRNCYILVKDFMKDETDKKDEE